MEEKDRIREINVDDIKSCLDRDTSAIVEDSVTDMLEIVRTAESEQDYWFVNYYQGAAFSLFFIGMMAGLMSGGQDLPADRVADESYRKNMQKTLSETVSTDVWNTFKGREELAFRLFAYGVYYVRDDGKNHDINEEG